MIKMIKGEFHVVEYLGWETTYTEIVPFERLRVKSTEPHIGPRTFVRHSVKLPDDIKDYYADLPDDKHAELHKVIIFIVKACRIFLSNYRRVLTINISSIIKRRFAFHL